MYPGSPFTYGFRAGQVAWHGSFRVNFDPVHRRTQKSCVRLAIDATLAIVGFLAGKFFYSFIVL